MSHCLAASFEPESHLGVSEVADEFGRGMHLGSGVEGELPLKPGVVDCYDHIDRFHLGTVLYRSEEHTSELQSQR